MTTLCTRYCRRSLWKSIGEEIPRNRRQSRGGVTNELRRTKSTRSPPLIVTIGFDVSWESGMNRNCQNNVVVRRLGAVGIVVSTNVERAALEEDALPRAYEAEGRTGEIGEEVKYLDEDDRTRSKMPSRVLWGSGDAMSLCRKKRRRCHPRSASRSDSS